VALISKKQTKADIKIEKDIRKQAEADEKLAPKTKPPPGKATRSYVREMLAISLFEIESPLINYWVGIALVPPSSILSLSLSSD
jgi:hypothetical protein